MSEFVHFRYRDFYDFPRLIVVECAGRLLLLDSAFDDNKDEYPDSYEVFELPMDVQVPTTGSWERLKSYVVRRIGTVGVSEMLFDSTRRNALDPSPLLRVLDESNAT